MYTQKINAPSSLYKLRAHEHHFLFRNSILILI